MLAVTPPGFETVNGATTECPDTAYRAEWMPVTATSGAQCIPCGNGISASPTDYISVYAPTPDANVTLLPVKISGASCCEFTPCIVLGYYCMHVVV